MLAQAVAISLESLGRTSIMETGLYCGRTLAQLTEASQSRERSVFCGATRPLPLKPRQSSFRGNGRVAPQKTLRSRL